MTQADHESPATDASRQQRGASTTGPEHLGSGERYRDPESGRIYIQTSARDEAGVRTRTRLYDDGTVQMDRFGVDAPGSKHSHDIDRATLGRDEHWSPEYRRCQGGEVTHDRDGAAKRQALVDEAVSLRDRGALTPEDTHQFRAQWRNTGSSGDGARDQQLERVFRDALGRGEGGRAR